MLRHASSASARSKAPPEGWELIEPTLEELEAKMREAETESHEGKRKTEALWPIFKIHHQRSRYVFDLFYKRKAISRGRKLINLGGQHRLGWPRKTDLVFELDIAFIFQSCTTTA